MSIADEHNEEIYEQVRAILAEHFPNFIFCVMDDFGDVYYDYTNLPIGKMLMREMQDEMDAEDISIDWGFDEEEDNSGVWG
jgi:hypothetical protein